MADPKNADVVMKHGKRGLGLIPSWDSDMDE